MWRVSCAECGESAVQKVGRRIIERGVERCVFEVERRLHMAAYAKERKQHKTAHGSAANQIGERYIHGIAAENGVSFVRRT